MAVTHGPYSDISISLTAAALEKAAQNLKFDSEQLVLHVRRALDAHSLLEPEGEDAHSLAIEVTDIRIRSNFSAVMWGFMAGADSISGDIVTLNGAGEEVDRFRVSVSYALGGIAGGQDSARMGWMYEKFAEETLKELQGGNTRQARSGRRR
ncbi:MAG: DUF4410 domain-containing protein [Chromatiales bacterium]|nr:DUF4410 domain-containing protein [Chromatiales bacterium]